MNKQGLIGIIFILLSILLLFLNINIFQGYWALLILSLILFFVYIFLGGAHVVDNLGIILTCTILFSLWVYNFFVAIGLLQHHGFLLIFISFAFVGTFFIHRHPYSVVQFWPIYSGALFFIIGLCWVLAFAIWPLFFMLLGVLMLLNSRK